MIFKENDLNLKVIDVLKLKYVSNTANVCATRPFCAMSLRLKSNAVINCGNRSWAVGDGALAVFPAFTPYTRSSEYDDMIVVHFYADEYANKTPTIITDLKDENIKNLFFEILKIWNKKPSGYRYLANAVLYEIFASLYCGEDENSIYSETVNSAVEHIKENYRNPDFKADGLCRLCSMSPTAFRRSFKDEVGVSPKKYCNLLRMKKAADMLNGGYYSVKEVAESVGFTDAKNFATAFKKQYGYPPTKQHYEM